MQMTIPKLDLYPHNHEAYLKVLEMWQETNRTAVIHATGTGKSYIILQCLIDTIEQNAVVLAPSNYILEQLISKTNVNLPNTTLLTYSKLSGMSESQILALNPSSIVLDEFHRCGAQEWGKGVQTLLESFPDAKVLGTSATPIRYLDGNRDMATELFKGKVASTISLTDAIARSIVPNPKIVIALYTLDEEDEILQDKINKSSNDDESKAKITEQLRKEVAKAKGIPEVLKKHEVGAGKYIVFCKDKAHLHEIKPTVIKWFKDATGRIVEDYSIFHDANDNDEQQSAFRDNKNTENVRLMFSIEMYNEGIHIDDVTGVVLLRPTASPIVYFQQIGRAIQSGNTNQPLIFDFVNNRDSIRTNDMSKDMKESVEREKERRKASGEDYAYIPEFTIFDETVVALEMLGMIEDQLVDNFDANFELLKAYLEKHGDYPEQRNQLGYFVHRIRASRKRKNRYLLNKERLEKLESINFIWDAIEENWNINFEKLKKFLINHKGKYPRNTTSLGAWAIYQRSANECDDKKNMTDEKRRKLNSIGFVWNTKDESWNRTFQKYAEFVSINGHPSDGDPGHPWKVQQSKLKNEGKLTQYRIDKLNSIDFPWSVSLSERWNEGIDALVKHKEQFGHLNVLTNHIQGEFNLGNWTHARRYEFRKGILSKERIDELNSLGFLWVAGKRAKIKNVKKSVKHEMWMDKLQILSAYRRENGDCLVPKLFETEGFKLGRWVEVQRKNFKKGILKREYFDLLNKIDFTWEVVHYSKRNEIKLRIKESEVTQCQK